MRQRGLRADESYWALLVVDVGSAGGGAGSGAAAAGRRTWRRGAAGLAADGALAAAGWAGGFMRSTGNRLTFETVVAGGPTGGATELPTVTLSASGLPVLRRGAFALAGTT